MTAQARGAPPAVEWWILSTAFFTLLAPLATYFLLLIKGLPPFAAPHPAVVLLWVYQVTWIPALLAGSVLTGIVEWTVKRWPAFVKPYDFGRCFSMGAILGALAEASATWLYRSISLHPFSTFWIAGATIAGCLTGATIVAGRCRRRHIT